jgi:hypothetical protein
MDNIAAGEMSGMPLQSPDKNIDSMYNELQILKGSIQKLMIDIREQMCASDNPFTNLQQLQAPAEMDLNKIKTNGAAPGDTPAWLPPEMSDPLSPVQPQLLETLSTPVPDALGEIKKAEEIIKPVPAEARPLPAAVKIIEEKTKEETETTDMESGDVETRDIDEPKRLLKHMKQTIRETEAEPAPSGDRLDPDTIIKLMQWTRSVLIKNGTVRFHNLLDAYVTMGYLNIDTKFIIEKMSMLVAPDVEPVPKDIDIKECVGDMYSLFMILNPRDKNLDSKMLCVMLGFEDRTLEIL